MNRKGMTLMEILVSLGLISIVMLFVFNILSDLKNEDSLSETRSVDALTRTNIVNLIQNDFINKKLIWINKDNGNQVTFTFQDGTKKILKTESSEVTDTSSSAKYIIYGSENKLERWEIHYGTIGEIELSFKTESISLTKDAISSISDTSSGYYYLTIKIPINVDATSKRKYDIELTSIGLISDLNPTS